MYAVDGNEDFHLFCPKTLADNDIEPSTQNNWYIRAVKIGLSSKVVKARSLWKTIQEQQLSVGRPYIFYLNNAQENSPFKHIGDIKSANLCVESYSYFETDRYIHCCNLISINLAAHESFETIAESAMIATTLADKSLDLSYVNILEVQNHVKDFRTIGVGLMGLADWLAFNGKYYSEVDFIEETAKVVALACYSQSVLLAAELKACNLYAGMKSDLWDKCDKLLPEIAAMRAKTGIRNSMLLATAPNTSTSLTMGSTASFLPPYQLEFFDESEDFTLNVVVKYDESRYLTNFQLNQEFITNAAIAIQKWTDAGISMEYLLPKGASWSDNRAFSKLKFNAWDLGCKTVYYTRTSDIVTDGCSLCAN
jgi:ribonucleoside-diphosphate reductase alpha chain